MKNHPPKLAQRLFDWLCGSAFAEDLRGDLDELHTAHLQSKGKFRADLIYWFQVVSLGFSYSLKKRKSDAAYSPYHSSNSLAMMNNYFKIALRNFQKQKLFTTINIIGLALGMSICLLALSISVSIIQSDGFHEKKDRIYQINTFFKDSQDTKTYGGTFPALGDHLEKEYPFIETALTIHSGFRPIVNRNDNQLDFHGYFVDPEFFDVFSFDLVKGNAKTALSKPNTMILTTSVAEKLFRDVDPIGKVVSTESGDFTITGIMPNLKQTHLYFEVLTSTLTYDRNQPSRTDSEWIDFRDHYLYVLLQPETNGETLKGALSQASAKAMEYHPYKTIQLESVVLDEAVPRWNISNALGIGWDYPSMLFFLFIGLLILLPAIFNYTNLSIARAIKRSKEIGIRKVVGAAKHQVKMQFIVETVVMMMLALAGSFILFVYLQQQFLDVVAAAEVLETSTRPSLVIVFVLFGLIIGVLSGIFPAVYFSKLNPVHSLKGGMRSGKLSVSGIKKGLFVFQFGLSLFFIIGVATIARQYQHVFNKNHGFEYAQVLTIPFNAQNKQVAMQELEKHPDVQAITSSSSLPGINMFDDVLVTPNDKDTLPVREVFIGEGFVKNMKMQLEWGNTDDLQLSTQNEEHVLVNEKFFKSIRVFERGFDTLRFTMADGRHARIIGVLKDINYETLSKKISPMVFRQSVDNSQYALLSLQSTDLPKTLTELEQIWQNIDQNVPFEASFLDTEIQRAYQFLTTQIKFFSYLGGLAVTIACLGLLGMVAYTTENRTKEIAIRKILGTTMTGLYLLLAKDFIKLIGLSALLAVPLAYFFYEKIFLYMLISQGLGLGVWEIVGSVLFLFSLGFAFIYWQTSKVAQANPATNLRTE